MTGRWRWLRSLRFRITAIATVVFAAVLIGVGLFAVRSQDSQLVETIDDSLRETIREVELALDLAPNQRGQSPQRRFPRLEEELSQKLAIAVSQRPLQLVSAEGEVLAASAALRGAGPLVDVDDGARGFRTVANPFGDEDDRYRIAVFDVAGDGDEVLIAAKSLQEIDEAGESLKGVLILGVPVLIAAMGGLIWMVTGRALAPVERIRSEVAEISASDLDRRVSVPTTSLELEALTTTMNEMLDRLDSSAKRQQRFVADASHELRSPLAGMRSQLEVNIAHPADADWSEAGSEVLEETIRMQVLVDDLLALARSERRQANADRLVDLDDLVLSEAARLRRDTEIDIDLQQVSAAQTRGDSTEFERVVRNLAVNAARHAATTVSFRVEEFEDRVEVEVSDDGPGIPAEDADAIFERFSRLDEARDRDSGGSGLGLAIARELVERNGGSIALVAVRPAGARFLIELPTLQS
jgi:signal transduction histidine kinase